MSKKTIIANAPGVVDEIRPTGDTWLVHVTNPQGGTFYADLDAVAVSHCQTIKIGDVIGYQNVVDNQVVIGYDMFTYRGNGTSSYSDPRLAKATKILWGRGGTLKDEGQANDSYTWSSTSLTGTITSTEVQNAFEFFTVFFKNV